MNYLVGKLWSIVVATEMAKEYRAEVAVVTFFQELGTIIIAEMPTALGYAVLEDLWIITAKEHVLIVISFHNKRRRGLCGCKNLWGFVTHIGQESEAEGRIGGICGNEIAGIRDVVRDLEGADMEVGDVKRITPFEGADVGNDIVVETLVESCLDGRGHVDRQMEFFTKDLKMTHVVVVGVAYDDAGDRIERLVVLLEDLAD